MSIFVGGEHASVPSTTAMAAGAPTAQAQAVAQRTSRGRDTHGGARDEQGAVQCPLNGKCWLLATLYTVFTVTRAELQVHFIDISCLPCG